MILLTGDLHGHIDIEKFSFDNFPLQDILSKNDYIIVLGDFGLLFSGNSIEKENLKWLASRNWTTLFIDGNHENFDMLKKLSLVDKFGGKVGKVNDSIFHLLRGEVYTIENKKFFTFGGAASIDKASRIEGVNWWRDEVPSFKEIKNGLDNLEKNKNIVDYVLTHTCPQKISNMFVKEIHKEILDPTMSFLDEVDKRVSFKKWFFGHWHDDIKFEKGKYVMLYDVIRGIE